MPTAAETAKKYEKKHGERSVTMGVTTYEAPRIPFGIYELDYATGGGMPRGRMTEIFGGEGGGKTNLMYLAIAQAQQLFPDDNAVFIDVEHASDRSWMGRLGVDPDKVIHVRPSYGEQVLEAIEDFMVSTDVSIVVIDSTAAIAGIDELEKDAEKGTPGNATQLIQRITKRMTSAFATIGEEWEKGERPAPPAVGMINQIRSKIGVMYGSPESTPGGNAVKHLAGMRIRNHGTNVVDPKFGKAMPVRKKMSLEIKKWKVPILTTNCEFEMAMLKHGHLTEGQVDSWNTVEHHLKHFGFLKKDQKKGWLLNMEPRSDDSEPIKFDTLVQLRQMHRENFDFRTAMHAELFEAGKREVSGTEKFADSGDDDGPDV